MRRADRLFRLVQLLQNRRFATAQFLAESLGVSLRTVYRDVQDLSRSGVPILGEAGVGYRLDPGHQLPPMTFNTDELAALVLGARMVEAWCDPELAKAARSVLDKVEAVLPESLVRAIGETPLFAPSTFLSERRKVALGPLRKAIGDRNIVDMEYETENGDSTKRRIWPLGLYFFGSKWVLAAWCELRQDYRSFRPDRILELEILDEHFETIEVSLDDFLNKRVRNEPCS